jgi:hypothetical protein
MSKVKHKFERREFEVYCKGRSYRIIRNYEGRVSLAKYVNKPVVGWTWQYVASTTDGIKALADAIESEIPQEDQQSIKKALLSELAAIAA